MKLIQISSMMNKKFVLTILFATFILIDGKSQEYLTGFVGGIPENEFIETRDEVVATLPFFDDFTNHDVYPDATKWQSKDVFVNSGFAKMPVNYRTATFDLLDLYGKVYSHGSSNPFIADSLLSVKIRLDSIGNHVLTPDDSVYFSFYYQPGGFGDSPETDDSLVLKFGYGQNGVIKWKQMWAAPGEEIDAFTQSCGPNKYFKKVMIPIVDTCFFKDEFYILFYNYGTLPTTMYPNDRSNMDQWNVDMVYLDMNRSIENDTYPLVSFTNTFPSLMKRYKSMPYKHFVENPINEIDNEFDMYLTNLDINSHIFRYACNVEDNNSGWNYNYMSDDLVVSQYSNAGVQDNHIKLTGFIYPYNLPIDTTSFTFRHCIQIVDEHADTVEGDTIVVKQEFSNYFAYDDGSPEMGYGLIPNDTYFAMQFKVAKLDTLRGVRMLFNRTFNNANYNFFDIVVWKDNNGKPGQEIYVLKDQRPEWNDSVMYAFSNYTFDKIVKVNGIFYVGIRQQYSKSINIGFDSSNDNRQYCFYDVGEGWKNTSFHGSLMIRPVMGTNPEMIVDFGSQDDDAISLYPNPATDVVRIGGANGAVYKEILIYDMTGRLIKQSQYCNELNVNDLRNGVYMLCLINENGTTETSKLFISK